MLSFLKELFQQKTAGLALLCWRAGITPNLLTWAGFVLTGLSSLVFLYSVESTTMRLLGALLLATSGFTDAFDGVVARIAGIETRFGGVLDSTLDRYADIFIISSFILSGQCDALWGLVAITGSILVSYLRARSECEGVSMSSIGLVERAERLIIIIVASIAGIISYGVITVAVLSHLTVFQRLYHARQMLSAASPRQT